MNDLTCCDRPAQSNMHEVKHEIVDGRYVATPCWNRICSNCYTHWYGHPDSLKKYSRKEWDLMMDKAFEEPAKVEW